MTPTTFVEFVNNLEALAVAGVTRRYPSGPPGSLKAADLPASWVQFPFGSEGNTVFGEIGGNPVLQADLVIATEAYGLSRYPENFDLTVAMMDNVAVAVRAMGGTSRCWPAKGLVSWATRLGMVTLSGNNYWAVITRFEARGGF